MKRIFYLLLPLQAALVAILCFGDIGFDKPGRYGLAYEAGIVISLLYIVALATGLVVAYVQRRRWLIAIQLLPLLLFLADMFLPEPRFEAARYQFLVGKTKEDYHRAIGHPRGAVWGRVGEGNLDEEFVSLRGMKVYFSNDGRVVRVESASY